LVRRIEDTLLRTEMLIPTLVKHTVPYNSIYNRLPEDEPSGSKHAADIKKLKIKIFI
jgi:hypothetical protein